MATEARHELEGIVLPPVTTFFAGSATFTLNFNGAGVRSVNVFGWDLKVYVAGFYTSKPLSSEEDVMNSTEPMQLNFTFLRSFNQGHVTEAWQRQIAHSVEESHLYDGYDHHRDYFVGCFGPMAHGGTATVQLHPESGQTILVDQGRHKGVIESHAFQKAFLSMWFGTKAVAPDLKAGLLMGNIGQSSSVG